MTDPTPALSRNDFSIAIICTLPVEAAAVGALFDDYPDAKHNESHGKAPGDTNEYMTGRIGHHNVVLVFMPEMGKGAAAGVAASLRSSYSQLKLAVLLGVCGGVPKSPSGHEILLGDVVVSSGVIQYDFGRLYPGKFIRRNSLLHSLHRPGKEVRTVIAKLKTQMLWGNLSEEIAAHLAALRANPRTRALAAYPGLAEDRLFEASYPHKHHSVDECEVCSSMDGQVCSAAQESSCQELGCDESALIPRQRHDKEFSAEKQHPMVHFGLVASGDTLMRSGHDRDIIASKESVIAFEMEGAGAWDILPCVLIKGVSDYADSHKNKKWQGYASATAAACLKAFLGQWTPEAQPSHPDNSHRENPKSSTEGPGERHNSPARRPHTSHNVEIEKDVKRSVVASALTNTGGIDL
ncbi:nucleoside phosphorylase domain-containing protein [Aspergillus filifer]